MVDEILLHPKWIVVLWCIVCYIIGLVMGLWWNK